MQSLLLEVIMKNHLGHQYEWLHCFSRPEDSLSWVVPSSTARPYLPSQNESITKSNNLIIDDQFIKIKQEVLRLLGSTQAKESISIISFNTKNLELLGFKNPFDSTLPADPAMLVTGIIKKLLFDKDIQEKSTSQVSFAFKPVYQLDGDKVTSAEGTLYLNSVPKPEHASSRRRQ